MPAKQAPSLPQLAGRAELAMTALHNDIVESAIESLGKIRSDRPRVHVLTNFVAMNTTANVMLAVGAVPSMTIDEVVIEEFVGSARALVVNLGQLDPWRKVSVPLAIAVANRLEMPWVLDPVKVDRAGKRLSFARMLMDENPAVIRCNRDEVGVLEGMPDMVLAVTGEIDHVADGEREIDIANGSQLMDRVTAMGCALSAVVATFLAVEQDRFLATSGAVLIYDIAGEAAAAKSNGPGTFAHHLLDALYHLDATTIREMARLR